MCGILGVLDKDKKTTTMQIESMLKCLQHRGPDDKGSFIDTERGVWLGQHRLSLIDLSPAGHQPMTVGSHTIVYNGEVYNYTEIRKELSALGVRCSGDSDTEVVLRAWQQWGGESLKKFRGMFAFAIWDSDTNTLTLCRDRVGVKPLYFYQQDSLIIFASELKAIFAHPRVAREIDNDALQLYLQLGYVPAPYSIFKNISKVLPGHLLTIDNTYNVYSKQYWNFADYSGTTKQQVSETDALNELERRITDSATLRMIADVPVGVFLSGGIDSSLVTAVLKKQGFDNLSTFTIGFEESTHNEATHAKKVAEHLRTKHHELFCTTKDAQEIIPQLPTIFDEPFADASAIPTYLLSQFAKQHVTAALSADGGDELFGGYTRYHSVANIQRKFSRLPPGLGWFWNLISATVPKLSQWGVLPNRTTDKFKRVHLYYKYRHNLPACYAALQSSFTDAEIVRLLQQPQQYFLQHLYHKYHTTKVNHPMRSLQHIDFHSYLPDDVLTKVDRTTMAVSLEGREPLLDQSVIEYSAGLPDTLMHKDPGNKYLLRQLLYKYIPRELVDRPKQGFGVPLNEWLRSDLSWLIDEYLSKAAVEQHGLFSYTQVERIVADFRAGHDTYKKTWHLIVFQMWYQEWMQK